MVVELVLFCVPISGYGHPTKGIGGRFQQFDTQAFHKALSDSGSYSCEGNLLWIGDVCSGVPIRQAAVTDNIKMQFPNGPAPIWQTFVIAVPCATYNPMEHLGVLEAVSPEEDRLVVLKAAVRDIDDPGKMKLWAAHMKTVPLRFELLPSHSDRHFRDVALREQVVARFNLVARTTYGRIIEIWNFKISMEREMGGSASNAKLAEMCSRCFRNVLQVLIKSFKQFWATPDDCNVLGVERWGGPMGPRGAKFSFSVGRWR